ncbi:MAG: nucleotidyltransferase family protein [Duncaniella sp.]|nr:nucleotidyltransferase family protein [Duncaniella sp.]
MKAMIFAAGLGTRLRPLTDNMPKALIDVGGRPMIDRVIERIQAAGVEKIIVNVHYCAEMLSRYLLDNYHGEIIISDESEMLLDTGGALVKALPFLDGDEEILVYNSDILSDFPIEEMHRAHVSSGADVTLLADHRETSRYLLFDKSGRMRGWKNVSTGETRSPGTLEGDEELLAFGGVHIITPSVIREMRRKMGETKFSITPYYIETCGERNYRAFTPSESYNWVDIGKPESLAGARELVSSTQF